MRKTLLIILLQCITLLGLSQFQFFGTIILPEEIPYNRDDIDVTVITTDEVIDLDYKKGLFGNKDDIFAIIDGEEAVINIQVKEYNKVIVFNLTNMQEHSPNYLKCHIEMLKPDVYIYYDTYGEWHYKHINSNKNGILKAEKTSKKTRGT